MFGSLRTRLAVGGILVAIIAVVVTAIAVQQVTKRDIRSSIQRDLDTELFIRDEVAFAGLDQAGWADIKSTVRELALATGERIAVASLAGDILADSEQLIFGADASLPSQATIVDPQSSLIDFGFAKELAEDLEFQNQIAEACLAFQDLASSRFSDESGLDLVLPATALDDAEAEAFIDCLVDEGIDDPDFSLDTSMFETGEDGDTDGFDPKILGPEFLDPVFFDIEPVQLFIGYGDDRDAGLFPSLRSGVFWLAVAIVVALAATVAVLMARRLSAPIATLTAAAQQMRDGDLTTRVKVTEPDELGDLGRAFNDMATSLQAEDQARKTLTTDVAHELRSPLANLRGYLEGIQDGLVLPDAATISSLHEETTAIQSLVDDLQQLSLAETGRLNLRPERTDVGDLIERVVAAHAATAASAGVTLTAHAYEGVITSLDPDRMRQVLTNLVANAVRYTPPGGAISVLLNVDDEIGIEVRDNGEGIAERHLPHLFERFYRADESRTRATGGSGLGLAIVQELVHAHGGRISVRSQVGAGTAFHIALPR